MIKSRATAAFEQAATSGRQRVCDRLSHWWAGEREGEIDR